MTGVIKTAEIKKAVIPAAGLGTRLLPATKAQPKEMLPLVDRPAIQYVVEEAVASGISDILMITGRGKRTLEDHFDRSIELEAHLKNKSDRALLASVREISEGPDIFFIRQKEPLGLGHAILCARKHVDDEPFAVMLGDDIFLSRTPATKQMMDFYRQNPGIVIAVQEVLPEQIPLYGIVSVKGRAKTHVIVDDLVEKPVPAAAPSNLAIVGRYILPPEIFAALEQTEPDAKGEIQLTDAIRLLRRDVPIYGFMFEGKRYDIGSKLTYLTTNIELALQRPELADKLRDFLKQLLMGDIE